MSIAGEVFCDVEFCWWVSHFFKCDIWGYKKACTAKSDDSLFYFFDIIMKYRI